MFGVGILSKTTSSVSMVSGAKKKKDRLAPSCQFEIMDFVVGTRLPDHRFLFIAHGNFLGLQEARWVS